MNLSIIIPSIRIEKWPKLIKSIKLACKNNSYEIIFVGPKHNDCMYDYDNIKFVRDFGHPNRCQQIGLLICEGDIVTWGSDDGLYSEDSIDKCLSIIKEKNLDYLSTGYTEAGNPLVNYSIRACYLSGQYVSPNWYIFNVGFIKREIIEHYGFDTNFEVTCIGHADLACRVQNENSNGLFINENVLHCEHMEGSTGDHAPIFEAQTYRDSHIFCSKYSENNFKPIQWNEWKNNSETVWSRRFKK